LFPDTQSDLVNGSGFLIQGKREGDLDRGCFQRFASKDLRPRHHPGHGLSRVQSAALVADAACPFEDTQVHFVTEYPYRTSDAVECNVSIGEGQAVQTGKDVVRGRCRGDARHTVGQDFVLGDGLIAALG